MSLINCPECGKENVSDTANFCPYCGYNIAKHTYGARQFEELKQTAERLKEDREQKKKHIEMPEEPSLNYFGSPFFVFACIAAGLTLINFFTNLLGLGIFFFVITIILLIVAYYDAWKTLQDKMEKYNLALRYFEAYKEQIAHEQQTRELFIAERDKIPVIKCPVCNSENTQRISNIDRAASVAMVGIASAKIGKQYKCRNCGHMW